MYVDGTNFRRIGRELGVNPQSVANWVKAHADRLPKAPMPEQVDVVEMDELFTFIKTKKADLLRDLCGPCDTLHHQLDGHFRA
jgi:transposase-like protein